MGSPTSRGGAVRSFESVATGGTERRDDLTRIVRARHRPKNQYLIDVVYRWHAEPRAHRTDPIDRVLKETKSSPGPYMHEYARHGAFLEATPSQANEFPARRFQLPTQGRWRELERRAGRSSTIGTASLGVKVRIGAGRGGPIIRRKDVVLRRVPVNEPATT